LIWLYDWAVERIRSVIERLRSSNHIDG